MLSHRITNLAEPTANPDAVTKNYVDTALIGNISGSGAAGQVAYFDGPNSIKSEAGFEYDEGTDIITVGKIDTGNGANEIPSGTIWSSANDGAGTGLDADLLDGEHASAYLR